jgi:hypothetical protein
MKGEFLDVFSVLQTDIDRKQSVVRVNWRSLYPSFL